MYLQYKTQIIIIIGLYLLFKKIIGTYSSDFNKGFIMNLVLIIY